VNHIVSALVSVVRVSEISVQRVLPGSSIQKITACKTLDLVVARFPVKEIVVKAVTAAAVNMIVTVTPIRNMRVDKVLPGPPYAALAPDDSIQSSSPSP